MTPQFTELKVDPSYQSNFPFFFFCLSLPIAIRGIQALFPTTFVFAQWCGFEAASCPRHKNVERRYKLWATRQRTIVQTFCCGQLGFNGLVNVSTLKCLLRWSRSIVVYCQRSPTQICNSIFSVDINFPLVWICDNNIIFFIYRN